MKKMKMSFLDNYNAVAGSIIAVFSMIFGKYWFLFVAFLVLNVLDWLTGWLKARMLNKENSKAGLIGILKKLGYWIMILVAFLASNIFIEVGLAIGVDLTITTALGYFVLASLLVNELRSIIENFVEAGFEVPKVLVEGLEVANKIINKEDDQEEMSHEE